MFKKVVTFLTDYCGDLQERRTLIRLAFNDYPWVIRKIDFSGDAQEFTTELVNTLRVCGQLTPERSALWHLLLTLREDVGFEQQQAIDSFEAWANTPQEDSTQTVLPSDNPAITPASPSRPEENVAPVPLDSGSIAPDRPVGFISRPNSVNEPPPLFPPTVPIISSDPKLKTDLHTPSSWPQRLAVITLGAVAVMAVALIVAILQPHASVEKPQITPTSQGELPITAIPAVLSIGAKGIGCDTAIYQPVQSAVESAGGKLETTTPLMTLTVSCASTACPVPMISFVAHMPSKPAAYVEFLDETPQVSVCVESNYAPILAQAVTFYALGNYAKTRDLIGQLLVPNTQYVIGPDIFLLQGQTFIHLGDWNLWRDAYAAFDRRLQFEPTADRKGQARAYAGRALAQLLRAKFVETPSLGLANSPQSLQAVHTACNQSAMSDYKEAIALDDQEPLWQLGYALAIRYCLNENLVTADDSDKAFEEALNRADTLDSDDTLTRALVLSVQAAVKFLGGEIDQAILLANEASTITPQLAMPYRVLTCAYSAQGDIDSANTAYSLYIQHIGLNIEREVPQTHPPDEGPPPIWCYMLPY